LHELQDHRAELIVLESSAFETLEHCRHTYQNLAPSVLLIVRPGELADVLGWLRNKDDVCVTTVPPSLVAHRIRRLADSRGKLIDSLTGVFARTHLVSVLQQCSEDACRQRPVSLVLADLDHFKAINDRHGHAVGDYVLEQCGAMLRSICGPGELAARSGGQEFAVLAREDADRAYQLADRIRQEISAWPMDGGLSVTLSLGVATAYERTAARSLFRQADEALYAAKAQGRNVTVSYPDVQSASLQAGEDVAVTGLENRARVLAERVANFITRRSKRLLQNMRAEAETDALTRFYTRRYLDRRLSAEFDRVARRSGKLTVALIDVDHFGRVNKVHGWPTGDKVLREVCDVIRKHVRSSDWIGRYGGEEFCVVMPHTTLEEACAVLQRVRVAVAAAKLRSTSGSPVSVTLSIGVAICGEQDDEPAALLERASAQTLAAKRAGRDCLRADQGTMSP